MDLLFLGGLLNRPSYKEKSKNYIQNAADTLQKNIISGFYQSINRPIRLLNSVFIGSFPYYYEDLLIHSYKWEDEKVQGENIGFINIPVIKNITRAMNITIAISKWAKIYNNDKILFVYSMHAPFLIAAMITKKINPRIKVVLMVPDLPEYMSSYSNVFLKKMKKIDISIIKKLIKYIDYYILLTKEMAEELNINKDNYLVIEGMVSKRDVSSKEKSLIPNNKKTIVYTGSLSYKYGIGTLLKAFKLMNGSEYQLIICGSGEAEEEIRNMMKEDKRIRFLGLVSRSKSLSYQNNATCLINPRPNEGEYVKYSFPSKTMEYLLSGRPTVAFKLPGIPEEYDQYIYYIDKNTPQSMAKKLTEVCEQDDDKLNKFGINARKFVLNEKNNDVQAERILQFITQKSSE